MLKKQHRGLTSSQVAELFGGSAQSIANRFFRVNWKEGGDRAQFVVITGRKFHKSALRRNRFRRQLYELIRMHFSDWTVGVRVAILVKNSVLECSSQQMREAFVDLMQSAGLFQGSSE